MELLKGNRTLLYHKIESNVEMINVCQLCAVLIGLFVFYWLFYVPYNWEKQMDDVGYDIALGDNRKSNGAAKKDYINRIRNLRNIGLKELPPPYPNGWYSILESCNLKRGESKSVYALGEQLVVFRTLNNTVYVLDAYCPHLGANLGIGGRVIGDSIECPFHKWSFRGKDGKCANVPYSSCVPSSSKIKKWLSQEVNGNIFIWYSAEPNDDPWEIPIVHEIESGEFVFHGRNEFYVNCHIQEIPENGADLAHFGAIHNASILAGVKNPSKNILKNIGKHKWEAIWGPCAAPTKHIACIRLTHSIQITQKIHIFRMNITGKQIGPSYVHLQLKSPSLGRIDILQTVTPIGPMVQKVVHRFYASRFLGPLVKFIIVAESIMFERDVAMWNHKIFRKSPQLVKEDGNINSFRKWYEQFYSANSKTFSEAYENFEW